MAIRRKEARPVNGRVSVNNSSGNNWSAERWAIRRDTGPLSAEEEAQLDAWLREDERREGLLLRAEAALAFLDRARAIGAQAPLCDRWQTERSTQDEIVEAVTGECVAERRNRGWFWGAVASMAAAASFGGFFLSGPRPLTIDTAVGEVRQVPLADGSLIAVNTDSDVSVELTDEHRLVGLKEGEAWFRVAKDRARPFLVEAGPLRVQAIGTAFSVRRQHGEVEILVTEGVVETWLAGREDTRKRVASGQRARTNLALNAIGVSAASENVTRTLAWRGGELILDGQPLVEAIAEMNRYNVRQVVLADQDIANEPIIGFFQTNDPEAFARAVAELTGARVRAEPSEIRIE